ncbi:MAG: hypothetical protein J5I81_10525 [Nitrococcus mobilis]|nr:hypothetical protein [Nitrococcus mobilis]
MLSRLSLLFVIALLVGCGWHLRGSGGGGDLDGVMVYVLPEMGEGELANITTDTLRSYGAQVVDDQQVADWVLVLLGQQTNRRTVSVTPQGQARAYELRYTLRFRVDTAEGEALLGGQTVAPQVVYQADPQNVLGRESQERRLTEQLRHQALDLMMGRLAGIPRS